MISHWPRVCFSLPLALLVLVYSHVFCNAEPPDEALLAYAVYIHRTPLLGGGSATAGYGIYLGKGLFITAAHVAGRTWWTRPKIVYKGKEYPTHTLKEGSFEGTDLTLLAVDENLLPLGLRLRRNSLCNARPWPGEEVVTIIPDGAVGSHVLAPRRLPPDVRQFSTVIGDVANTGNSGSGVFDAQLGCLLGIMSRKISGTRIRSDTGKVEIYDMAKYFVPASVITRFLPRGIRF